MLAPEDKAAVHRLLGMITYLAKFIPNMSQLTYPITMLLNKNKRFEIKKSLRVDRQVGGN